MVKVCAHIGRRILTVLIERKHCMDNISALIPQVRQAFAWNTLSNEEIIEQALLLALNRCCGPNIEFWAMEDDLE